MSQSKLAELAGIPFPTYRSIDMGNSWPEYANVQAIAKALGVPESRLFQDPEQKPSPEEALEVLRQAIKKP